MNIIEFIQNNIFIVIGVLFFLYKMFSGSKAQKGNSMPTFGGGTKQAEQADRDHYDDEEDSSESRYEDQHSLEQRRRAELQRLQEEQMAMERQMQRADQLREEQRIRYEQQQRAQQATVARQVRRDDQIEDYFAKNELGHQSIDSKSVERVGRHDKLLHGSALTANELRKAVLWSEVLSSPRAKRPYRR